MSYRVVVVDDSTFFRRRVSDILNKDPELDVVGTAINGKEAIDKVMSLDPDVVTMDIEMPLMDGITAVREIMARKPVPILMFSSLTYEGATATLDAMDAGALDFLPKKFEDIAQNKTEAQMLLCHRVRAIARRKLSLRPGLASRQFKQRPVESAATTAQSATRVFSRPPSRVQTSAKDYQALAIGTSTGGPAALQSLLSRIPKGFRFPIFIVQHMPGTFTKAFAQRLDGICQIRVKEAQHGDPVTPGVAYLAPGGKQMLVEKRQGRDVIVIRDEPDDNRFLYKPSVDVTFESVGQCYGGQVLAMILTGMGADGREGCRKLKALGAKIWAQDEQSCVVYGMPMAVANAGLTDEVNSLENLASRLLTEMR